MQGIDTYQSSENIVIEKPTTEKYKKMAAKDKAWKIAVVALAAIAIIAASAILSPFAVIFTAIVIGATALGLGFHFSAAADKNAYRKQELENQQSFQEQSALDLDGDPYAQFATDAILFAHEESSVERNEDTRTLRYEEGGLPL